MITETNIYKLDPDITVVQIKGRLHLGNLLASAENSVKKLISDGARKVVVDLAELDYIDSAGIGFLVSCHGTMDSAGGMFRVSGAKGSVAKVFGIGKLDRLLLFDADLDASRSQFA